MCDCTGLKNVLILGKIKEHEDSGVVMIVILSMANLSTLVPGLIAIYICVCMIIVDLGRKDQTVVDIPM